MGFMERSVTLPVTKTVWAVHVVLLMEDVCPVRMVTLGTIVPARALGIVRTELVM